MKSFPELLVFIAIAAAMGACSSESNTWTSKAFHNTTAHYNGYYYSLEEIRKIENVVKKARVDDYNRILRLFPTFDTTMAKGYEKEVQEAVKMASIAIQRHPNSNWVDDAYIVVGKARMYSLDWGNAIQTFKHVNTRSKDKDARHLAIINLTRTYTEHREYGNAQAAIDFLKKQELSKENRKRMLLEGAYLAQERQDLDLMVRYLSEASPMLTRRDDAGRVFFIIGQVYQKLGFEAEAYNFYRKCLAQNPAYEVDFYARLYMAQVTEISRNRDINAARKSFRKLLKDSKNREFKDKIFYEMGVFELKQNHQEEGIGYLNKSIREGSNKRIDGEAYLRLGELYYDSLKNYELSQAYYDSAIGALPPDYENYKKIKTRQEVLNEFVQHLKTIQWQDSLLTLSSTDSATIMTRIKDIVSREQKAKSDAAKNKKKNKNRINIDVNNNNNIFNIEENQSENSTWYFGNPSAMASGEIQFARRWGNITLEDNWRRSARENNANSPVVAKGNEESGKPADAGKTEPEPVKEEDLVAAEYAKLTKEIPRSENEKQQALAKIEEAYFRVAEIYLLKLEERENAIAYYLKLLGRFPKSKYEPEALYALYLIYKDIDQDKAASYADLLKSKHPNSTFAKILVNPNYFKESNQAVQNQKELYRMAYEHYQQGDFLASSQLITEALALSETPFTPNLLLLRIMILGQVRGVDTYQTELTKFVETYPEHELTNYAKKLLETSQAQAASQADEPKITYSRQLEAAHYFVLVYDKTHNGADGVTQLLSAYCDTYFKDQNLKVSVLPLNDTQVACSVTELSGVSKAIAFFHTFTEKQSTIAGLSNLKFHKFVITKENFDIFYRTKGLDEYLQFFEKYYPATN